MAKKRITELATETTLKDGQYVAIDHATDGTKKYNIGGELTDLKEDLESLESEVSTLTDAVTLSTYNNDKVPYLFRASGGGKYIGGIEKDTIVGGTVAWNQLASDNLATPNQATKTWDNATKTYTLTCSNMAGTSTGFWLTNLGRVGKVILITEEINPSSALTKLKLGIGTSPMNTVSLPANTYTRVSAIAKNTGSSNVSAVSYTDISSLGLSSLTINIRNVNVFDLTQMFGSTIADHIYSLEQATAGSGVAKLKEWGFFTEDYYPYDAGTLKSVEGLEAHITRDADENIIGNYPLDSDLTLRGIPKLDSGNNLYYDGDVYASDGSVSRKYGVVDLGTLTWTKQASYGFYSTSLSSLIKNPSSNTEKANVVCPIKVASAWNDLATGGTATNYVAVSSGYLGIAESQDISAADFKTAMSGVMLVYELATPTTETADPYQNPQIVDKNGTEEYVTTGIVPVGHDTEYYLDADSVLTPPSTAGTYSLKVTVASDGSKSYSWVSD